MRQFDEDVAGDAWIVLDLQAAVQLGEDADSTVEQAVLMAAALADEALRSNRAVGLAAYGQNPQIVAPKRGQGQRWRILQALALLSADADADLSQPLRDLSHVVQQGSAVMVITPSGSAEWIPDLLLLTQRGVSGSVAILTAPASVVKAAHWACAMPFAAQDLIARLCGRAKSCNNSLRARMPAIGNIA